MEKKTVTVEGGKYYTIQEYGGTFYVRRGGWSGTDIGKAGSYDDALAIVKSDSGKPIKSIS